MGGMGGGMRSVPPTGPPFAVVGPGQTLRLPTRLVSLGGPSAEGTVAMPAQGEKLTLGDVAQLTTDPRVAAAVRRLAAAKAPSVASQLVLWNVSAGLGLGRNRQAVGRLGRPPRTWPWPVGSSPASTRRRPRRPGRIYVQVEGDAELSSAFAKLAKGGIAARPQGRDGRPRDARRAVAGGDDRGRRREG